MKNISGLICFHFGTLVEGNVIDCWVVKLKSEKSFLTGARGVMSDI